MGTGGETTGSEMVTLVSTNTVDRLPADDGQVIEIPGGPARYCAAALERLGVSCHLITGEVAMVDVVRTQDGERYVIPALSPIPMPEVLPGSAAILSPIMREIDPDAVPRCEGLLSIDLQGFIRQPGARTDEPVELVDLTPLLSRCAIVKAAEHELAELTPDSLAVLEDRILVVTRGERGALVRVQGTEHEVRGRPVHAPHTIGAGDTFLAAFVVSLVRGCSAREAAEAAARFTEAVLLERLVSPGKGGHGEQMVPG